MTDSPNASGIVVGNAGDIDDGEALIVPADTTGTGQDISVFFEGDQYFALNDRCTHGDASLADGWIEDGQVECPLHSGKFCLKTGQVLSMPATDDAPTHRVELVGDDIVLYPGVPAAESADR